MAKSRLEQLNHWESTRKGHQVSDMETLLKAFGFKETGKSNHAGNEFSNGEKSEYFKVDNTSAHVPTAARNKLIELCRPELTAEERKGELTPLSIILKQEQDILTDLKESYGIEVSIAKNEKDIVFECKGADLRKYIKREGNFDLSAEADGFIEELEEINSKSEVRLADLKGKAHSCSEQLGVKYTLTYGTKAVDVNQFGIGFIDVKELKAAEKLFKKVDRALEEEKEQPALKSAPVVAKTSEPETTSIAKAAPKSSAEPEAVGVTKPEAIDMTRRITGGQLLTEHVNSKQFMWDTLKTVIDIKSDRFFLNAFNYSMEGTGVRVKQNAIDDFFNPEHKDLPSYQDKLALKSFIKETGKMVKEAEKEGKIETGAAKKFGDAFKEIQGQMETRKDQQHSR